MPRPPRSTRPSPPCPYSKLFRSPLRAHRPAGQLPCRLEWQFTVILLMGVSGVGKTTIGRRLADALDYGYAEGDDYHPSANVEKMRSGRPLEDDDRWPWMRAIDRKSVV